MAVSRSQCARLALSLYVAQLQAADATGTWTLVRLNPQKYPKAQCLDGSYGALYFMPGSNGHDLSTFVLHIQGGGWCTSLQDCADRAAFPVYAGQPSIGSTTKWGPGPCTAPYANATPPCVADGGSGGILSNNATVNPVFHTAAKAWLGYCDGGGFAGTIDAPVAVNASTSVYFRGAWILEAAIDTLLTDFGMNTAQNVVLSGCSAGGMSTFLNADRVGAQIAAANAGVRFVAAPGAGFILDFPSYAGNNIVEPAAQWIFDTMGWNASVSAACVSAHAADAWRCFFPENTIPFTRTPLFVSNSAADLAQMSVVMALPCDPALGNCNASALAYLSAFKAHMMQALQPAVNAGGGGWLLECVVHMVQNVDRAWNGILVSNQTQAQTFVDWYYGGGQPGVVVDSDWTDGAGQPYGGNPMCGDYGPVPSLP